MTEKRLHIGDEDNAILIIQKTQSDPQKALAELVENSIDARAETVHIVRRRHRGSIELIVSDDGEGINPGDDGNSDMDRVATNICDSFKRKLTERKREGVQGEFAIGLLGFAAISESIELRSRCASASKSTFLRLRAGSLDYESGIAKIHLEGCGTEARLWPVEKSIASRLTADKTVKYLGEELRERIRSSGVCITVEDRVGATKTLHVKPRDYGGERIRSLDKVATPMGNLRFRLFIAQQGDQGRVSIYRKHTRIIDDVTEIPEFDHGPWNNDMLEGMIESRFINVPPGTRRGIIPDKRFRELLDAARSVENEIRTALEAAEEKRERKLSRDIVKALRDAYREVVNELPEEYNWFTAEGKGPIRIGPRPHTPSGKRKMTRIALGPLEYVTVTPKVSQITPSETKSFKAKAWTPKDELIPMDVVFSWHHTPRGLGNGTESGDEYEFTAGLEEGEVKIEVVAELEGNEAATSVEVLILKEGKKRSESEFPTPRPVFRPSEGWRSRWSKAVNTLEYNTGHEDYQRAKAKSRKAQIRYLGLLFAKHLVLHNFGNSGEDAVLERMIEVVGRLEGRL
jgi:hypothetical protein